jgi:hypothetical protein
MRRILTQRAAANTLLLVMSLALAFQLIVLMGFIPTEMVWGGRLANERERALGTGVSISVLVLMGVIVLGRVGRLGQRMSVVARWGIWVVVGVFALNTVGNLFAMDPREALIFTPVTAICTVLALRVALDGPFSPA